MSLVFSKVVAQNFRSIGNSPIEFNFDTSGKTTMIASLDNGAGKSTLCRGVLEYVLFNKYPDKKVTLPSLVNSINKKDMVGEVHFTKFGVKYVVKRGAKPSLLEVWKNDKLVPQEAANNDYNAYIEQIIGMDIATFRFVVSMGKETYKPFIELSQPERRSFIDQLFDLTFIPSMVDDIKKDIQSNKRDIAGKENDIALLGRDVSNYEDRIQSANDSVERQRKMDEDIFNRSMNQWQTSINREKQSIEDIKSKILSIRSSVDESKQKVDECTEKLEKADSAVKSKKMKFNQLSSSIKRVYGEDQPIKDYLGEEQREQRAIIQEKRNKAKFVQTQLDKLLGLGCDSECPTCSQHISKEYIDKASHPLYMEIDQLGSEEEIAVDKLKKIENTQSIYADKINELNEAREQIVKYEDVVEKLKSVIDREQAIVDNAEHRIDDLKATGKTHIAKISELNENKPEMRHSDIASDNVSELELKLDEIRQQIKEKEDELDLLYIENKKFCDALDVLSESGFKADIIDKYIPFINDEVNKALLEMNLLLDFTMDNELSIDIKNPIRKGQSVYNLSTGQRAKVDLAIMLAFRKIASMKASLDCNILIADELLENLSETGIEQFIRMWKQRNTNNINLFVVTQRKQEFEELFDQSVVYKLVNDFTEVEDGE